jgi:hypothetical protein
VYYLPVVETTGYITLSRRDGEKVNLIITEITGLNIMENPASLENLKGLYCMQKTEKSFCEFIAGLFYAYVFDTQPSNHPIIQSSNHPIIQSSI